MANYHALLSPSGANKWVHCPNSIAAEDGQPDVGDVSFRDIGSDKHELLEKCLKNGRNVDSYFGEVMGYGTVVHGDFSIDVGLVVAGVNRVISAYRLEGAEVILEVEQKLPIGHITGEVGATGTADVVILAIWPEGVSELCIIDAKFGYRQVDPEENLQLMMYGLGGLEKFAHEAKFKTVRLMIAQPALSEEFTEWSITAAELETWGEHTFRPCAAKAIAIYSARGGDLELSNFNPGEKQCQWCKAKAVCQGRSIMVQKVIGEDFDHIDDVVKVSLLSNEDLGGIWQHLEFIEGWCKDVRTRVVHEMLEGVPISGLKVVEGRAGNRVWMDEVKVVKELKKAKVKKSEMYVSKLLGPTAIMKLFQGDEKRLTNFAKLIVRNTGSPVVCKKSDKRLSLEIKSVADDFSIDNSDLT